MFKLTLKWEALYYVPQAWTNTMKNNNLSLLNEAINPWIGAADDDAVATAYLTLNSNDQIAVLSAIRADIIPHLLSMSCHKRAEIEVALRYAQTMKPDQLERIWDSNLPPFPLPETPSLLFKWISEELARNQ